LRLRSADADLPREFASVFGGEEPPAEPVRAVLSAIVDLDAGRDGYGRLDVQGDDLADPAAFLLGFSSPTVPLRALPAIQPGEDRLGLGDDPEPVFLFKGGEARFRLVPRWRRILSHFLFLRALRLRPDLVFFHAASLAVRGRGVLIVGPKGAGKSTTALALAARGHAFLGDETAAYEPASGLLHAFRRPVGIKPGPRASGVEAALARLAPAADEDGLLRVGFERVFPEGPAAPGSVPLDAVVFLGGFAPAVEIERVTAGRDELAAMQPLASSLVNESAGRRVFEMIRLLSSRACYRLRAGAPDATAEALEAVLTGAAAPRTTA
jgi:HPr kinase/phosphorylase